MLVAKSFAQQLVDELGVVERAVIELLNSSTIEERQRNDPNSAVFICGPTFNWGDTDSKQKILQLNALELYQPWMEKVRFLFANATGEITSSINKLDVFFLDWINKESGWDVPATIDEAKTKLTERIKSFKELLSLKQSGNTDVILVPDTNALILAPDVGEYSDTAGTKQYTVVILPTVMAELDKLKIVHRDEAFRKKVKSVSSRIKGWRKQGSILSGVTVNKTVTLKLCAVEPDFKSTLSWLDSSTCDDRIVASTLELQRKNASSVVILVTADINLQTKAEQASIPYAEPPGQ